MALNLFLSAYVVNNPTFSKSEDHTKKRKTIICTIKYPRTQNSKEISQPVFHQDFLLPIKLIFHIYSKYESLESNYINPSNCNTSKEILILHQSFLI